MGNTPKSLLICYRRLDSQHAAFAIADRLGWAFGHEHVFFDRSGIDGGVGWPDALRNALSTARVMLALIGKNWLRAADEWGRRSLDDPKDWGRLELCEALSRGIGGARQVTVIPVWLDGVDEKSYPSAAFD